MPAAAVFASANDEIAFLGKTGEATRFTALASRVTEVANGLQPWTLRHPLELLKYGEEAVPAARFPCRPGQGQAAFSGPRTGSFSGMTDIEVTAAAFAALRLDVDRIITTENLVNFLALPSMPRTLAVFGRGYGFESIREARWLDGLELLYWGDIDTHGFHILDQLRSHQLHVRSLLMDTETLLAHRDFIVREDSPSRAALTRLTPAELALYTALQRDEFGQAVRLEQELLRWDWVMERLH